jgi:hypothetical protein
MEGAKRQFTDLLPSFISLMQRNALIAATMLRT